MKTNSSLSFINTKGFLLVLIAFIILPMQLSFSQGDGFVQDSVILGKNFENQVYYSFKNSKISQSPVNNWDIAFSSTPFQFDGSTKGLGIRINEQKGVQLFKYPNGDTADWLSYDTTGIKSWPVLHNKFDYWDMGAFNTTKNAAIVTDYGWGDYGFIVTDHEIIGDSLYVIKLANGDFKKLKIYKYDGPSFYFHLMDMDSNNFKEFSCSKEDYNTKLFGYFDLENELSLDRGPDLANWHISFTKYTEQKEGKYLNSVGVLSDGLILVEERNGNPANYVDSGEIILANTSTFIDAIGTNWYDLVDSVYTMKDSVFYIIADNIQQVDYLLVMLSADSETGKIVFGIRPINGTISSSNDQINSDFDFNIYPNPSTNFIKIATKGALIQAVEIVDLNGRTVVSKQGNFSTNQQIDISTITNGIYYAKVFTSKGVTINSLIKMN
ncbi:MAG: hypothetical protein ACJAZ3_001586 [Sphingobacteriales bacterium]|jgi:hypothetical protein